MPKRINVYMPDYLAEATSTVNRSAGVGPAVDAVMADPLVLGFAIRYRIAHGQNPSKSVKVCLYINEKTQSDLTSLSEKSGLSVSTVASLALEDHLLKLIAVPPHPSKDTNEPVQDLRTTEEGEDH